MFRMNGTSRLCTGCAVLRDRAHGCATRSLSVSHGISIEDVRREAFQSRTAYQLRMCDAKPFSPAIRYENHDQQSWLFLQETTRPSLGSGAYTSIHYNRLENHRTVRPHVRPGHGILRSLRRTVRRAIVHLDNPDLQGGARLNGQYDISATFRQAVPAPTPPVF
jgi:hypothetical protein